MKRSKLLEKDHKDEYLAVSFKGKTILGNNLYETVKKATDTFGPANSIVYKVGQKFVGKRL